MTGKRTRSLRSFMMGRDAGNQPHMLSVNSNGAINIGTLGSQQWSVFSTPIAQTAPSTSRAGVADFTNVVQSISFTLAAVADQGVLTVVLRDGATGVGTVKWSLIIPGAAAKGGHVFSISGLNIPMTVGNAATLETTGAPAATNFASVAMTGIVV